MRRGSKGKSTSDREVSRILTTYNLCKEFGKLPSELDKEDEQKMNEMLIVMSEIQRVRIQEQKKREREMKKLRKKRR